jgi:hypothetical protein
MRVTTPYTGPYVGVTGFTDPRDVEHATDFWARLECQSHRLMVGLLASEKSLRGLSLNPRWGRRYPRTDDINHIWNESPVSFNALHYHTTDMDTLRLQLDMLVWLFGARMDGIQLNMTWPDPGVIWDLHDTNPALALVLQIGPRALRDCRDGDALRVRVEPYMGAITHILIDPSAGSGSSLIIDEVTPLVEALDGLPVRPVVAGGLCSDALPAYRELLLGGHEPDGLTVTRPALSWDAEGRLMASDGRLDDRAVGRYLSASHQLLRRVRPDGWLPHTIECADSPRYRAWVEQTLSRRYDPDTLDTPERTS